MHDAGVFMRILESNEHPEEIDAIFRRVDEATKNFQVCRLVIGNSFN
jgi:hypothetical protein